MGDYWRTGRSLGRTLYLGERCVGMVDTPELAERIARMMNRECADCQGRGHDIGTDQCPTCRGTGRIPDGSMVFATPAYVGELADRARRCAEAEGRLDSVMKALRTFLSQADQSRSDARGFHGFAMARAIGALRGAVFKALDPKGAAEVGEALLRTATKGQANKPEPKRKRAAR